MVKQQKNLSSSPASPHWRRLDQQRDNAPSRLPLRALKTSNSIKHTVSENPKAKTPTFSQDRWWRNIPFFSWLLTWLPAMSRSIIGAFTAKEPHHDTKTTDKNLQPNAPSTGGSRPSPLATVLDKLWQIIFWGSGLFLIVLPWQWIMGYYNRAQQAVVDGVSTTLDKKTSAIPLWIREVLLIVLAIIILPFYLRDKLFLGSLRAVWWLVRKTTLFIIIFWLYFPLAVFIVSAILGNSWLIPSQYLNIGLWIDAMEYY